MATYMRRTLLNLHRVTCSTLKSAETALDVGHPLPIVLPVRTKKRYRQPPAVRNKGISSKESQDKARAAGFVIRQEYDERPINISCTGGIADPYIPPEGDARLSTLSKEGLKQRTAQMRQSAATQLAIRKIKTLESDFSTKAFALQAQEIFIEAHNSLTQFNKDKLHSLVTERCYPEMTRGNRYKTIRWRFIESLEPPRVVQVRCPEMVHEGNLYGQVTLRMHSRQTLAIYDRFGRLMLGNEEEPKDVLEYLVLERHLVNPHSRWRLHGKIIPAWAPPKEPVFKTTLIPGPDLKPGEEFEALNSEVPKPTPVQGSK